MKDLEEIIGREAIVKEGHEVDVDAIFSQYVDVDLLLEMSLEWKKRFQGKHITKIVTVESSGIALATLFAAHLNVPVVIVKKTPELEVENAYTSRIYSHQYHQSFTAYILKRYLTQDDHIIFIDDFLSNGWAAEGIIKMVEDSGAKVEGVGVAVEKGQKNGGKKIRSMGYQVESLAIIDSVDENGHLVFKS
jgi:xanthine phosphoribosyltransferase